MAGTGQADLIVGNARIHTLDRAAPQATSMAVADGRLVAIGSDSDVAGCRRPETRLVDLGGATVLPGLVDVHNHHQHAGQAELYELTFSAEASYQQVLDAVAGYASSCVPSQWIVGSSWGTGLLDQLNQPGVRQDLDRAAGGRPVMLTDDSHHNRWVNSAALQRAGIGPGTADPDGGVIVREGQTQQPNGLLLDAAGLLVSAVAQQEVALTPEQLQRASTHGIGILHSYGITTFQDAAISLPAMQSLAALDARGDLHAWIVSCMTVNDELFGYARLGDDLIAQRDPTYSRHHRPDFIKIFLDGTPPAHSGAFLQPYLPDNTHGSHFHGETTMSTGQLMGWLTKTAALGISAKIHCTGDAAVRMVLDAVESVRSQGYTEPIYHIAHGQFISASDLPRMASLGVVADISPFLWFPGVIADALGTVRPPAEVDGLQPNRSLIDSGALVAGGSDWPVSATPNPWQGIQGLVTRADPSGHRSGTLGATEAISVLEAIEVFTINGARAMGLGETTGSLQVGKSADFVVLDRDPFDTDVSQLAATHTAQTWFAGKQVYPA